MTLQARFRTLAPAFLAAAFLATAVFEGDLRADDFRMVSSVFQGDEKKPVSVSTTLFQGDTVYDYLSEPLEAAVCDTIGRRIVLLDPQRRVRTEISVEELEEFAAALRKRAAANHQPLLRFHAEPRFEVEHLRGESRFASPWVRYVIKTEPAASQAIAGQYAQFADWNSLCNAMRHKGSRPPFARLEVNAALRDRGLLPRKVRLTIDQDGQLAAGARIKTHSRSEHVVAMELTPKDRQRIDQTEKDMLDFTWVSFVEF